MILATLLVTSLIVTVAVDPNEPWVLQPGRAARLSLEQKKAAIRPLVSSATECIARTVSADPRLPKLGGVEFNNLIVESVPSCVGQLRRMIEGYDTLFGDGTGETFFMGPYLDSLPDAVTERVKGSQ